MTTHFIYSALLLTLAVAQDDMGMVQSRVDPTTTDRLFDALVNVAMERVEQGADPREAAEVAAREAGVSLKKLSMAEEASGAETGRWQWAEDQHLKKEEISLARRIIKEIARISRRNGELNDPKLSEGSSSTEHTEHTEHSDESTDFKETGNYAPNVPRNTASQLRRNGSAGNETPAMPSMKDLMAQIDEVHKDDEKLSELSRMNRMETDATSSTETLLSQAFLNKLSDAIEGEIANQARIPSEHTGPPELGDSNMIATWVLGKQKESCAHACDRQQLLCEESAFKKHLDEVGDKHNMGQLVYVLGETCTDFDTSRSKDDDTPAFAVNNGNCFLSSGSGSYNCLAKPREDEQRVCFCSVITSREEAIPVPEGVLG